MSDTPRTDANVAKLTKSPDCFCEAEFASELERENRTLRAAQKACEDCDAPSVGRIDDLERELAAERKLADRLAELVQRNRDSYGGQVVNPRCKCQDCEYLAPIDDALAAWKDARRA